LCGLADDYAGAGLAPIVGVFTINSIDVEVHDVPDTATIEAVERTVQNTYSHLVGAWHVRVSAADERGNWDLRVKSAFGHHIAPFWASPDRVAETVERQLRSFLRGVVAESPRRFVTRQH
jgi:hypothetical protein